MDGVVVVATFRVHPGKGEEAVAAFAPTIEQTHAEEGCLAYALHRDVNDPDVLVLVERWTDREALGSHLQQSYVSQLGEAASEFLAEPPTIHFAEPVPIGDDRKGSLSG